MTAIVVGWCKFFSAGEFYHRSITEVFPRSRLVVWPGIFVQGWCLTRASHTDTPIACCTLFQLSENTMFRLASPCIQSNARRVPPLCACIVPREGEVRRNIGGLFPSRSPEIRHLKPPRISPNVPEFLARSPAPPSHNGSSANDQTGVFGLDKLCRRTQVMHRSACRGIHASHETRGQQGDAARLSCAG